MHASESARLQSRRKRRARRTRRIVGQLMAVYLKAVDRSTRRRVEPADAVSLIRDHLPVIVVTWHGEHFMVPFANPPGNPVSVLVSKSLDGEVNAAALETLGIDTIRGSGGRHPAKATRKGAVQGFLQMKEALAGGRTVVLTADVPKGQPRRAGLGALILAKHSGRPVLPVAVATRFNLKVDSWDRSRISLPLGVSAHVYGDPIYVEANDDDEAIERKRQEMEDTLNRVTARARELSGRRDA